MESCREFVPPHSLKTPVLFLIFNRLDTTQQVFEAIRKTKPSRFYVAGDGPRENKPGEAERVQIVREYVMSKIDWECEVKTLFREKNLGCGKAVSSAITWFFENEERGIILEDDCLPSQSFFWFCEELLERYKDDERVWHIGGCNFQNGIKRGEASYYFSIFNHIWGWASWKSRWDKYDFELKFVESDHFLEYIFFKKRDLKYWENIFKRINNGELNTWDYQWTFTMWFYKKLAILPNVNLISNIGFSADAAHTTDADNKLSNMTKYEVKKIVHPWEIVRDIQADEYTQIKVFLPHSVYVRGIRKLRRLWHALSVV